MRHEAQHREDDKASQETRAAVEASKDDAIAINSKRMQRLPMRLMRWHAPPAVVVPLVVAAESSESTDADRIGEEDLGSRIDPHLKVRCSRNNNQFCII
jgi:hypothetical protein